MTLAGENFYDWEQNRVLVGHGTGVSKDASGALADTFYGSRRRLPQSLISNLLSELQAMVGALLG